MIPNPSFTVTNWFAAIDFSCRCSWAPETPEFLQAIHEGEQAVKLRFNFVLAHDALAGLYLKSNQIELAKRHAQEALRLQPTDQVALYHLIQALRKIE
jgi:tetratricopeptide (TPR) repeat protein